MAYDPHATMTFSMPTSQSFDADSTYQYMPDPMASEVLLTHSPSVSDRKACADPRLLHNGPALWPHTQQDEPVQDVERPTSSGSHSYSSRNYAAVPDQPGYDNSQMAFASTWAVDTMPGNLFGTPADAAGDALTPPESDGCLSPSEGADWRSTKTEDSRGFHPYSQQQRRRPSASVRSNSPHMRPDGYKKKNAKFDIPADRDLHNIEELIKRAQARGDDAEVKVLKTQKRLLRNREAALHSRQKKKDYTADLERKNKILEDKLSELTLARDHYAQQNAFVSSQAQQARNHALHVETERNILQAKVGQLEQRLHTVSTPMSSVTSSTGYSDAGTIQTDASEWDLVGMDSYDSARQVNTSSSSPTEAMLMLLMSGAARALPAPQAMPANQLPEHVRIAAPTILNAIFQRAGASGSSFQPAGIAVNKQTSLALDQIVHPSTVTHFRNLMTEASKKSP